MNVTFLWILSLYIWTGGLSVMFHASWWYTQNNLEHLIWNKILQAIQTIHPVLFMMFLHDVFIFFRVWQILIFDNGTQELPPHHISILSEGWSRSLCASEVLLLSEFMNILLILIWENSCILSLIFILPDTMNRQFV